ncbi:MAG: PilZ domain-containing protein [Xanthobacteraceae bacterium]
MRSVAGRKMGERRESRRQKSFLRGFVYFDKRRGVTSCLVRDISDEGARIILSETVAIPDVVNLHIPQREQTLRARVQWRRRDEIGLAFTAAVPVAVAAPQSSELTQRVAQLEAEIAALRRTVKLLKRDNPGAGDVEAA